MPDPKTRALQLNLEGLLRLLGGTASERQRFWEIWRGVTKPAVLKVLNTQFASMAATVKQLELDTKALKDAAPDLAKEAKASG